MKNKDKTDKNINERFIEGNEIKLLEFDLIGDSDKVYHLALNIQKVKEVVECENIQNVPSIFSPFVGIYNLRNIPVPIIDILYIFDNTKLTGFKKSDRIIICDFQKMLVGIVVNKTRNVMTYDNTEVISEPKALDNTQKHFFNGLVQRDTYSVHMLDIEFILDSLNVDLGSQTVVKEKKEYDGRTVLILEDSKFFQKKICSLFEKLGFRMYPVFNGAEGISKLEEIGPVDLIFSDIEMPVVNGIGFARKIKEDGRFKDIPIIFNTSLSNPALRDDIAKNHLGEFIVKFDEEAILEKIRLFL